MTSAKIFNFTSMLTMLHEVISNGHQNFNVSYKSKMQSSQFFETKKCNIVCILQLYCIEVQSKKYFTKQFRARVDIDTLPMTSW